MIDDFGTGYSNLHCISDMNPGYVKMDKDFTAKAMSCERDYELFKKIIEMVHSIGIRICVEGIEKEDWHLKMKELQAIIFRGIFLENPVKKRSLWKSLFAIRIIMAYGEIVPLRRCYFTIQIFIEISYLHETEYKE